MKWMDRERSFWVIGGDLRQRALARLLREDGHTVHIAGLEGEGLEPEPLGPGLALAHCVILPLPVAVGESFVHTPLSAARLPLAQVLDCLRPGQLVCGGMISPAVAAEMKRPQQPEETPAPQQLAEMRQLPVPARLERPILLLPWAQIS